MTYLGERCMVHVQNFGAQLLSLLNIEVLFQAF